MKKIKDFSIAENIIIMRRNSIQSLLELLRMLKVYKTPTREFLELLDVMSFSIRMGDNYLDNE